MTSTNTITLPMELQVTATTHDGEDCEIQKITLGQNMIHPCRFTSFTYVQFRDIRALWLDAEAIAASNAQRRLERSEP